MTKQAPLHLVIPKDARVVTLSYAENMPDAIEMNKAEDLKQMTGLDQLHMRGTPVNLLKNICFRQTFIKTDIREGCSCVVNSPKNIIIL